MTTYEIIKLYIADLKSHVSKSDGRDSRIYMLEQEAEKAQLFETAHNSDSAKLCDSCLDKKECTWQSCDFYRKA